MDEQLKNFQVLTNGESDVFWNKLTKENGWSLMFAQTAFEEYKHFLHLVNKYNTRVVPSKVIDTVWHLHMTFTQSYWNDLCKNILNREIHHVPSDSNRQSQLLDISCYEQTRELYEKEFGYPPSKVFWGVNSKLNPYKTTLYTMFPLTLLTACTSTFNDDITLIFKWLIGGFAVYKVTKWLSGGKGGGKGGSGCGSGCGSSCGGD